MPTTVTDWRPRAAALAERIAPPGPWRDAVAATPRHVFVPGFYDGGELITADTLPDVWLDGVYSDETLVTQVQHANGIDWPTSSSTRPSLMVEMLELLDIHAGHRVLEIGTGTGYNAALLCHRLGAARVTSIDIDAALVGNARERLTDISYHPQLRHANGREPLAFDPGTFDRLIATAGVTRIPADWLKTVTDGGLIVADVHGGVASNLVVLAVDDQQGRASGRFHASPGWFMPLRENPDNPHATGIDLPTTIDMTNEKTSTALIDEADLEHPGARLVLQVLAPEIRSAFALDGAWQFTHNDGSRADLKDGAITEYGPTRLSPVITDAMRTWNTTGRPDVEQLGLSAYSTGAHELWIEDPANTINSLDQGQSL